MDDLIKAKRPDVLDGSTYREPTGCGSLYVTINRVEGRIIEVFIKAGKAGGCMTAQTATIGKLISRECSYGLDAAELVAYLGGVSCHEQLVDGAKSCTDAVARVIKRDIARYAAAEEAKEDCHCGECDYCHDKKENYDQED